MEEEVTEFYLWSARHDTLGDLKNLLLRVRDSQPSHDYKLEMAVNKEDWRSWCAVIEDVMPTWTNPDYQTYEDPTRSPSPQNNHRFWGIQVNVIDEYNSTTYLEVLGNKPQMYKVRFMPYEPPEEPPTTEELYTHDGIINTFFKWMKGEN